MTIHQSAEKAVSRGSGSDVRQEVRQEVRKDASRQIGQDISQDIRSEADGAAGSLPRTDAAPRRGTGTGIAIAILGTFAFSLIDSSAKLLLQDGLPPGQVVFARFLMAGIMLLAMFGPRHGLGLVRTRSLKLEILRAVCMVGTTVTNFIALQYLPMTVTGSILFSFPLILCMLSGFFLGERVDWQRWVAVGTGFAAIVVMIHPEPTSLHPAMLLSLSMAVLLAFYAILTRKLVGVDPSATQQTYITGVGFLLSLPFAFGNWVWPSSAMGWGAFFLIGASGLLGHLLFTVAHKFAPATTLAPFGYVQLVFMALMSWTVFGQAPDIYFLLGLPVLIGSGLFIWFRELRLAARRRRAVSSV